MLSRLYRSKWPELAGTDLGTVFPQVVVRQVDVLPTQGRQELQQRIVHGRCMTTQGVDGPLQIHRVPEHDGRRDEVRATGAVALLLKAAVPDFAQPVEKYSPGQRVARLTLVQFNFDLNKCLLKRVKSTPPAEAEANSYYYSPKSVGNCCLT